MANIKIIDDPIHKREKKKKDENYKPLMESCDNLILGLVGVFALGLISLI